ncbi:hypothetical protein U1Q18_026529, partial [Sarracenia purpurea var. burkii]
RRRRNVSVQSDKRKFCRSEVRHMRLRKRRRRKASEKTVTATGAVDLAGVAGVYGEEGAMFILVCLLGRFAEKSDRGGGTQKDWKLNSGRINSLGDFGADRREGVWQGVPISGDDWQRSEEGGTRSENQGIFRNFRITQAISQASGEAG